MYRRILGFVLMLGALAACDDGTGIGMDGAANLTVAFATSSSSTSMDAGASSFVVAGSNGTLTIDDIYVVVSEFELEGELADCNDDMDDDCEEFESGANLAQIPTDGSSLNVASALIPFGTYTELEWEVEDLDFEDDDDEEGVETVRSDIEAIFGAGVWPAEASMAITGSFLEDGATTPTPFTTFFEAEIEVEMDLSPPLEISEESGDRELTIVLSPEAWFVNTDGTVVNLAALSGQVVEFEAEFENGLMEIERDDDDDDDDDDD